MLAPCLLHFQMPFPSTGCPKPSIPRGLWQGLVVLHLALWAVTERAPPSLSRAAPLDAPQPNNRRWNLRPSASTSAFVHVLGMLASSCPSS